MDKKEYQEKLSEINRLIAVEDYNSAAQVADSTLTKPTSAISLATSLEVASAALVTSLVADDLRIQMLQERVQMYVHPFVSPSRKLYLVVRRNWNYI